MNGSSEEEIQRRIYDLISQNPGLHLSKIAELLDMKLFEVKYHLQSLENKGIIFVTKDAGYERYYLQKSRIKAREKRTFGTRETIYNLIVQKPGLHLSKIAEILQMSISLADYHLVSMQKEGKITAVKDDKGYFKRYYVAGSEIKVQEKQIIETLRKKTPLKIVLLLLKRNNLQHKDIMEFLHMPSSSLSYHLTKLEEYGIIEVHPHGRERGYTLRNRDEIIRILKKYELHLELHLTIDEFKNMWDDLSYRDSLG